MLFNRQVALRTIQASRWIARTGYTVKVGDTFICVRSVDADNGIYQVTVVNRKLNPATLFLVEEMTPEQAVDRFQEFWCQAVISNALFGWINENE